MIFFSVTNLKQVLMLVCGLGKRDESALAHPSSKAYALECQVGGAAWYRLHSIGLDIEDETVV